MKKARKISPQNKIVKKRDSSRFNYEAMLHGLASLCDEKEVVLSLDKEGVVTFINEEAALRRFKRPTSKIIGCPVWNLFNQEVAERRQAVFHKVIQSGKPVRFVDERNGSWLDSMIYPLSDKQGRIQRVFVLARDITALKQKEKKVEQTNQVLENRIAGHTQQLEQEIEQRKKQEETLQIQKRGLEDLNAALKVLLEKREEERREIEQRLSENIRLLIMPYLELIMEKLEDPQHREIMKTVYSNLNLLTSPFKHTLPSTYLSLTPKEIQVANLIKEGKTTKEIAEFFTVTVKTVEAHRDHIRRKMGIHNKKTNLRTYLSELH